MAILGVAGKLERPCPQLQCQPEHHFETARAANGRPYAMQAIMDEWKAGGAVKDELGRTVRLDKTARGSGDTIIDSLHVESLEQPELRKKSFLARPAGEHLSSHEANRAIPSPLSTRH